MRDFFYGAQWVEGYDYWVAIKVGRDGNPDQIGPYDTEEEAEAAAEEWELSDNIDNSQFGVGA